VLKIGIIGLGDIALKAYLPVISSQKIEIHLYTRNENTLAQVGAQYRFHNVHKSLDALISSGVEGVFVHAPTTAHHDIVAQLLSHGIHVYVDKPITYDYVSSASLIALAEKNGVSLMVGFNRRFAPAYLKLKALKDPSMIVMQKNRKSLPGDIRTFVFDDFIHVVDTLLFLFPDPVVTVKVIGKKRGNLLYHIIMQLVSANGVHGIGIMNRDSGTSEEILEVYTAGEKQVVHNLAELFIHKDGDITKSHVDDWEPTLHKRGFVQIVEAFLQVVESKRAPQISDQHTLQSHKICEDLVNQLSAMP